MAFALTHRLHPLHIGRPESGAVADAQASGNACNSCLEPFPQHEIPAFHCNQCHYTVCGTCDRPKSHPVHPNHEVYYVTPTLPWRCNVCQRDNAIIQELQCYHCEQCDFHICKSCYTGVNSLLHQHILNRIDVRYLYHQSNGKWSCDVCRNNNGPGNFFPLHCSLCQFDLCDNCIKAYRSTFHLGHTMYKADSNVMYPRSIGGWRCDRCSRGFTAQSNNVPFHCSQCTFDLCNSCMRTTGEVSNAVAFDAPRPASQGIFGVSNSVRGFPIRCPHSDDLSSNQGRPGPTDNSGDCVICRERPKDSTIVHGDTGHMCCCITCGRELQRRGMGCPICRAPIDRLIRQY